MVEALERTLTQDDGRRRGEILGARVRLARDDRHLDTDALAHAKEHLISDGVSEWGADIERIQQAGAYHEQRAAEYHEGRVVADANNQDAGEGGTEALRDR